MQRSLSVFVCGLLLCALLASCQQKPVVETLSLSGATMGTTWSVITHAIPGNVDTEALKNSLISRLKQINSLMSTYEPHSEISRFNDQESNDCFPVSTETAQVIALAQQISELTDGAFDITVGPLVELWGFGPSARGENLPTDGEIAAARARVGYQNLELCADGAGLSKRVPRLRIDLSAIAKGYAVDALAEILLQQGISNFIVDIGGELRVSGLRADGSPWRVGIEKPLDETREVETVFLLDETGLATSGNYRNFYVEGGQRYAHTIDPQSGRPILHKLASATVLSPDCARADALATALMVMGEEKGRQFVTKNRLATFFLVHDGDRMSEEMSPAFEGFLKRVKK